MFTTASGKAATDSKTSKVYACAAYPAPKASSTR
jgi:hypothetical protein